MTAAKHFSIRQAFLATEVRVIFMMQSSTFLPTSRRAVFPACRKCFYLTISNFSSSRKECADFCRWRFSAAEPFYRARHVFPEGTRHIENRCDIFVEMTHEDFSRRWRIESRFLIVIARFYVAEEPEGACFYGKPDMSENYVFGRQAIVFRAAQRNDLYHSLAHRHFIGSIISINWSINTKDLQ